MRQGSEPSAKTSRIVKIDGIGPVRFEKSRWARRISISIRASRGVRVAVPYRLSFNEGLRLAVKKSAWMRRTLALIGCARERCRDAVAAAAELDRLEARALLARRLDTLAAEHGYTYRRLSIRFQGTLWGSASRSDAIQLNALLVVLPPDLADYVLLHELIHTRHKGHGPAFWSELERLMPDARRRQACLRDYSLALF